MSARTWQTRFDPNTVHVDQHRHRQQQQQQQQHHHHQQEPQQNQPRDSKAPRAPISWAQLKARLYSRKNFAVLFAVVIAAILYHSYLNSLYLVDEVYDGDGPRELSIQERFTIRMVAPPKGPRLEALPDTLAAYSICPAVAKIQLFWPYTEEAPDPTTFVYTKTHCPIVVDVVPGPTVSSYAWPRQSDTPTEGVLLLDSDVKISCKDLAFAYSVWRSSKTSLVGFFPRMHVSPEYYPDDEKKSYRYYNSWLRIWWNQLYSLMLPAGVFAHTALLQKSALSVPLTKLLTENPHCYHTALSVYAASGDYPTTPPIWVDVKTSGALTADSLADGKHEECLLLLEEALNIKQAQIPYSSVRSVRASSTISW